MVDDKAYQYYLLPVPNRLSILPIFDTKLQDPKAMVQYCLSTMSRIFTCGDDSKKENS